MLACSAGGGNLLSRFDGSIDLLETLHRIQVEKSSTRVKGRCRPICSAAVIRRHQRTPDLRLLQWIGNGRAIGTKPEESVRRFDERLRENVLPIRTIQQEEVAVSACLCEKFSWLPIDGPVK